MFPFFPAKNPKGTRKAATRAIMVPLMKMWWLTFENPPTTQYSYRKT
jgi:hypothetical protein